jgi:isoquinoline 1-oxidoreductase beta subunit
MNMHHTVDGDALGRREFLARSAGLTVALLVGGRIAVLRAESAVPTMTAREVNAWVTIAPDGIVTIRYGAAEMGQGVQTTLPLILAEELDAEWSSVRAEPVTHRPEIYGNPLTQQRLYTAGSSAVPGYFGIMRRAGATARRVLLYTAARHWAVSPSELRTEPGRVVHERSGRSLRYSEIVTLPQLVTDVPPVTDADLKPVSAFRLIGSEIPRLDVPAKVRGAEQYSIDVRAPGMLHAVVSRAPVEGEEPADFDASAARRVRGVVAVERVPNGVAVVAERIEAALAARRALRVTWTRRSPFRDADSEAALARDLAAAKDLNRQGVSYAERGDARAVLAREARAVEAEFTTDHVYHAQMEPLNVVAAVDADGKGAEIWVGTQSQTVTLGVATQVLGTTPDRIRFHATTMGGAFGRRTFFGRELLRDALLLSRQLRRPVKLLWTREDDVKQGWFRPTTAHLLRAALDQDGGIAAWHHRVACPSIFGFVAPESLAGLRNRDLLIMEESDLKEYALPNLLAEHVMTERRARISAWRGIGAGHNAFATESFVDELSQLAGTDPVTFRRRLLRQRPRALAVLDRVIAMSRFGRAPAGRAHGLAFAPYRASLAAGVAEVSLDRATGTIRVHRFWAAVDPGVVIQPRNLVAQVEGGIVFGLSGLLGERITIAGGEVRESNFHDYPILRASEVPEIEVEIVRSEAAPGGAGELGVPMTGGAVSNAIHALTGTRLRHMPFSPSRVRAALGVA